MNTFEDAVDGVAEALVGLTPATLHAIYTARTTDIAGVSEIPSGVTTDAPGVGVGIPDWPAAVVRHDGFEFSAGSYERNRHDVQVDLWFGAASPAEAEKALLPVLSALIGMFRGKVTLGGRVSGPALIRRGGPPESIVDANGQPFIIYPVHVSVMAAGPATYSV